MVQCKEFRVYKMVQCKDFYLFADKQYYARTPCTFICEVPISDDDRNLRAVYHFLSN